MLSIADIHQPYGSTARPYFLGKHLARHGVELVHICEKLPESEGDVKIISRRDHARRPDAELSQWLRQQCRQFSPDLIYSHQVHSARMAIWLSKSLKTPHVYDAHSSLAHELPTFRHLSLKEQFLRIASEAAVLWQADKIIAPSAELKDYFVKNYHLRPNRIRIVKNGAETNIFRPSGPSLSLRESLGIPREAVLILFTNPRLAAFPSNELALRSLFKMIPEIERRILASDSSSSEEDRN